MKGAQDKEMHDDCEYCPSRTTFERKGHSADMNQQLRDGEDNLADESEPLFCVFQRGGVWEVTIDHAG